MEKLNFSELREQKERRYGELLNECRIFFAFNDEQFNDGLKKISFVREEEKLVSIGAGGFMPRSCIEKFISGQKEINKWFRSSVKEMKEDHILYELINYECFYTGDISEAARVLPYKEKQILEVYHKHKNKYED